MTLRALQRYIAANLDDHSMSPAAVAAANGISVRQLHRLFQEGGTSIGKWVRRERLGRCAAELRDPSRRADSLTVIAFRWGFKDSAHFSRTFREQYGQTPRAFRASQAFRPIPLHPDPRSRTGVRRSDWADGRTG